MTVDFRLSEREDGIRSAAAAFAAGPLKSTREIYMKHQNHSGRFQCTRPIYRQAVAGGLIKGQIPKPLGGAGGTLLEAAILVEEMRRIEPSASLTIFSTGLGLTPINLVGKQGISMAVEYCAAILKIRWFRGESPIFVVDGGTNA